MRYLLDANAVIALLNDVASETARRARAVKPGDISISAIVAHELFYGAFKSQRANQNVALVDALRFVVLEFDKEDARRSGQIRALLASKGTPIGPYDVYRRQAVARNLTLVTHNTDEFRRVPGCRGSARDRGCELIGDALREHRIDAAELSLRRSVRFGRTPKSERLHSSRCLRMESALFFPRSPRPDPAAGFREITGRPPRHRRREARAPLRDGSRLEMIVDFPFSAASSMFWTAIRKFYALASFKITSTRSRRASAR